MLTTVRVWALDHNVIPDVEFCINNGIRLDAQQAEHERIETGNGQAYHYRISPRVIKLTTFDDRSEAMLQLKYGDRIKLLEFYYTETYERIT